MYECDIVIEGICGDGSGEDAIKLICENDGLLTGDELADDGMEFDGERSDIGVLCASTETSNADAVVSGLNDGLSDRGTGMQCALS